MAPADRLTYGPAEGRQPHKLQLRDVRALRRASAVTGFDCLVLEMEAVRQPRPLHAILRGRGPP